MSVRVRRTVNGLITRSRTRSANFLNRLMSKFGSLFSCLNSLIRGEKNAVKFDTPSIVHRRGSWNNWISVYISAGVLS